MCYAIALLMGLFICSTSGEVENGQIPPYDIPPSQSVDDAATENVVTRLLQTPLHFVANQGQMDAAVAYYAKSQDATVYCTDQGLTFGFADGNISLKFSEERRVKPEARVELLGKINYFIGSDPELWRANVPTFGEIVYRSVYPGIDLVYGGDQRRLKYTFYVQPGADPDQIKMTYEGVEHIRVDETTGGLAIGTQWGEIRDAAPVAYQEMNGVRKDVDIRFRVKGKNSVGFAIGDYNEARVLVLDPMYSTYLGGDGDDGGLGIAVDSSGNAYVTGGTESTSGFPIQNAFQESHGGHGDAFVTKLLIGAAGESVVEMTEGWNLISIPLQPLDTRIDTVLSSIDGRYDSVWRYDSNPGWRRYLPDNQGASDLWDMEACIGYWIMMREAGTLTIQGGQPTTAIPLVTGWNLVGFSSQVSIPIEECMSSIAGKYNSVCEYDPVGVWRWYLPTNPNVSNLTTMKPWFGYWIEATADCTWDID